MGSTEPSALAFVRDRSSRPVEAAARQRYQADLDRRIAEAATVPGATLESISSAARGAFPALVAERLRATGSWMPSGSVASEPVGRRACAHREARPGPELHAVEFEWYFTDRCAAALAGLFRSRSGPTLLLGAPTVARALRLRGASADLVDRSPFLGERFGSLLRGHARQDLRRPLPQLRSHAVVFFDAPWHEDHLHRWLWQASRAVARNGTIAFTLFGELTRPAARAERQRLLSLADSIGDVTLIRDALSYDTPAFERAALSSAGVAIESPWRRGDLVIVSRAGATLSAPPVPYERPWRTWKIGDRVVKTSPRLARIGSAIEALRPSEAPLATVSRRRTSALPIDAWSSRNVVVSLEGERVVAGAGGVAGCPPERRSRSRRVLSTWDTAV